MRPEENSCIAANRLELILPFDKRAILRSWSRLQPYVVLVYDFCGFQARFSLSDNVNKRDTFRSVVSIDENFLDFLTIFHAVHYRIDEDMSFWSLVTFQMNLLFINLCDARPSLLLTVRSLMSICRRATRHFINMWKHNLSSVLYRGIWAYICVIHLSRLRAHVSWHTPQNWWCKPHGNQCCHPPWTSSEMNVTESWLKIRRKKTTARFMVWIADVTFFTASVPSGWDDGLCDAPLVIHPHYAEGQRDNVAHSDRQNAFVISYLRRCSTIDMSQPIIASWINENWLYIHSCQWHHLESIASIRPMHACVECKLFSITASSA